jgi:hypothetical protein
LCTRGISCYPFVGRMFFWCNSAVYLLALLYGVTCLSENEIIQLGLSMPIKVIIVTIFMECIVNIA